MPAVVLSVRRDSLRALRNFVLMSARLLRAADGCCRSRSASNLPPREHKLLAPTPPMGWNSWDSYGESINEAQVRANAEWMAKHLKQFGWQYVVIDEGWYLENPGAKPADLKFVTRRERTVHSRREPISLGC